MRAMVAGALAVALAGCGSFQIPDDDTAGQRAWKRAVDSGEGLAGKYQSSMTAHYVEMVLGIVSLGLCVGSGIVASQETGVNAQRVGFVCGGFGLLSIVSGVLDFVNYQNAQDYKRQWYEAYRERRYMGR